MSRLCEWIGHKYRPRYDRFLPTQVAEIRSHYPGTIEAIKSCIYRGDVCQRCGSVVNSRPSEVTQ